jgi:hypothetical protein
MPREAGLSTAARVERINAAERAVRERVPQVTVQFSEPDNGD